MPEQRTDEAPAERAAVLFLTAETPVHAGSGNVQAALDLPIQRSVQTGWPIINDSTLRGALRGQAEELARNGQGEIPQEMKAKIAAWFGSEEATKPMAGAISTPDAEILLFPVCSVRGITALVTCREALEYFARKLELFKSLLSDDAQNKLKELRQALHNTSAPGRGEAFVTTGSEVAWEQQRKVVLEVDSYNVGSTRVDTLARWFADNACPHSEYWVGRLKSHFVLLPEHAFTHYTKHKTDVRTRVKLEHSVVQTGPWTEENLPVDTVLYTVLAEPEGKSERLKEFLGHIRITERPALQLGGDQNLGRGFVRLRQLGA